MKFAVFTNLLLAAPLASAQFDTVFALTKALGLTVKFDCALPCILESANRIPCGEKGPADTICNNIDAIAKDAQPCAEKCDADRASTFIQELTQYVCKQRMPTTGGGSRLEKNGGGREVKDDVEDQNTEASAERIGKDEL